MEDLQKINSVPELPGVESGQGLMSKSTHGQLLEGTFWYFEKEISKQKIEERKARKKVSGWILKLTLALALLGVLNFLIGLFLFIGTDIVLLDTWLTASPFMLSLWVAFAAFLFYFAKNLWSKDIGGILPILEDQVLDPPIVVPDVSNLDRTRNIANVLRGDAWEAIDEAFLLAESSGHRNVTSIHLFLGALSTEPMQTLMTRLGFTFDSIKDPLRRKMSVMVHGDTVLGNEAHEILAHAFHGAIVNNRKQVSSIEIFLAVYNQNEFLQELLYSVNIEKEEVENVVSWIRIHEKLVERYQAFRKAAAFKPTGNMNRAYTAGQTKLLDSVSRDLTRSAVRGALPMLIDRKDEMALLLRAIEGGGQSVVLVGPAGVGKNAIIAGVAERMVEERVPKILKDKRLVEISIPHLVSSQGGVGAQERLLAAMQEVGMSGNVVLVIEGIDQMVGANGSLDLSTILAGELEKGYTFVIGTATPQGYTEKLEGTLLGNRLQKIDVLEPERNDAILVLESKVGGIENKHHVVFTYEAVAALVDLTGRYIHESYLPEKAILVAREVALDVSKRGTEWAKVTKADIEAIITQKTNVPITQVTAEEGAQLLKLEDRIHERMIGQDEAVKAVASALRRARAELRSENRPIANFLFLGPTGVGKTELAKSTAEVYFGNEESMLRFDMSEYQDQASIQRLIGGSHEAGLLTEAVRKNPFSLLLLDELEKAHPDILNLFLQVMDDGRLTDGTGRTVDFTNIILIATSNAGTQYIQDEVAKETDLEVIKEHLMEVELRGVYRPEFLNRFDGVMVFKPLSEIDIVAIAYLMLKKVEARLEAKGMKFRATDEAVHMLAKKGYDPKFGARPLRRVIQEEVDNAVANFLLTGKISRRDTLVLESDGSIVVEKAAEL